MTKLKLWQKSNCDKSQKLKIWQNSNCDKNPKLKLWQKLLTKIVTKLKNSNCDNTYTMKSLNLWTKKGL